ncbi:MAG: hypothetical protein GF350_06635 [Chitinivibrionales bacterium]|nr:hypothetical protein [Chitinivibrionales bacterium]
MISLRNTRTFLFALTIICTAFAADNSGGLRLHGSMYSDLGVVQEYDADDTDTFKFTGLTNLSLNFRNTNRRYGKIEGLLDLFMPYGVAADRIFETIPDDAFPDSSVDEFVTLFSVRGSPLLLDVRNLYFSFYLPFVDITVGRRIINFGKGSIFSPVDIFSSVDLTDLNYRRSGSDIISLRFPFGLLSGCDIVAGLPLFDDSYAAAAKLFTTVKGFDFSLVGLYKNAGTSPAKNTQTTAGIAFKGDIEIGAYGEAVAHYDHDREMLFFEAMAGADYSLRERWIFTAEYMYKDPGYASALRGQHNAFGSVQYAFNDIMNISTGLIGTIDDRQAVGIVRYYYNILQNVDWTVYIQGVGSNEIALVNYMTRVEIKF